MSTTTIDQEVANITGKGTNKPILFLPKQSAIAPEEFTIAFENSKLIINDYQKVIGHLLNEW